jgi:hypothetical protein
MRPMKTLFAFVVGLSSAAARSLPRPLTIIRRGRSPWWYRSPPAARPMSWGACWPSLTGSAKPTDQAAVPTGVPGILGKRSEASWAPYLRRRLALRMNFGIKNTAMIAPTGAATNMANSIGITLFDHHR